MKLLRDELLSQELITVIALRVLIKEPLRGHIHDLPLEVILTSGAEYILNVVVIAHVELLCLLSLILLNRWRFGLSLSLMLIVLGLG